MSDCGIEGCDGRVVIYKAIEELTREEKNDVIAHMLAHDPGIEQVIREAAQEAAAELGISMSIGYTAPGAGAMTIDGDSTIYPVGELGHSGYCCSLKMGRCCCGFDKEWQPHG